VRTAKVRAVEAPRGDRDPEDFKLKIFQRCSLPNKP
jgi:hypothetical protein